jgi:tripartite-type tricarboxylate transporter receptor subunit TctC
LLPLLSLLAALSAMAPAAAQDSPLRTIVGYPAGATSDSLTRAPPSLR